MKQKAEKVYSVTTAAQRAAIRWQVRTGRYIVRPEKIAAAMISDFAR